MRPAARSAWIAGATITSLGTLGSRVLGMVRDMATAALLGLAGPGVMDAFVVAFRVPNLFRRLFGEGALAAGYVPVVAEALERDRSQAWHMARTLMLWIAALAGAAVLMAEMGLAILRLGCCPAPETALALGLSAVLMPYVLLASLAALLAANLQCLAQFAVPAATPMLLNICWLAAAWLVAPSFVAKQSQAYVLAVSVLVAGALQVAIQWARLRQQGFRLSGPLAPNDPAVRQRLRGILLRMGPMGFGMAVPQINVLLASLVAWLLTAPVSTAVAWGEAAPSGWDTAGAAVATSEPAPKASPLWRPLDRGATAALYYAERVYEFPLGLIGVAAGTALFPLLSRHAARGQKQEFGAALTLGLQGVLFLGIPASAGLVLLAEPLARLLFERGAFSASDTLRTAGVIRLFAVGVWAYCAVSVLVRACYALGEVRIPVRSGIMAVLWNLAFGVALVEHLAEGALALGATTAVIFQTWLLGRGLWHTRTPVDIRALGATAARAILAAAAMFLAGRVLMRFLSLDDTTAGRLLAVLVPLGTCVAVYLAVYAALGGRWVIQGTGFRGSDSGPGPSEP